uniref:Voltage-dependent calcium channel alpha-2/delta subunit conserved region domain-containing protein n=1 Tax=Oryzias melastigma TaxID=30732 RepID=A0A3B3CKQ6_ORYME
IFAVSVAFPTLSTSHKDQKCKHVSVHIFSNLTLLTVVCLFQIGRFFGAIDGSIMASLIKMGMFKKVSLFDYQAMCKNSHHHSSSARPLLTVSWGPVI